MVGNEAFYTFFHTWLEQFSDKDLSYECTDKCTKVFHACSESCDDTDCRFDCTTELQSSVNLVWAIKTSSYFTPDKACIDKCPCFGDCELGCSGCQNEICQCADLDNNEDYKTCEAEVDIAYGECILNCQKGDSLCLTECTRIYAEEIEKCPCQDFVQALECIIVSVVD